MLCKRRPREWNMSDERTKKQQSRHCRGGRSAAKPQPRSADAHVRANLPLPSFPRADVGVRAPENEARQTPVKLRQGQARSLFSDRAIPTKLIKYEKEPSDTIR